MRALILDGMISPKVAEQLAALGCDVVAIAGSPALRGSSDPEVLEIAAEEGRVLVTDNIKDFAALNASWAAQGRSHAGILFLSAKAYPYDRARLGRIVSALEARSRQARWPQPGQVDFL